jgi:hypothetical protein
VLTATVVPTFPVSCRKNPTNVPAV